MDFFVFTCAALMAIVGALGVVLRQNPVHAALSLVLTLFGVAVLFVLLQAEFLAAVQVIVYAGAIVVLFLFVIMLLGVDRIEHLRPEPIAMQRWVAGLVALGLGALLVAVSVVAGDEPVVRGSGIASAVAGDDPDANVRQVAGQIFGDYIVAFELTSILLVVAVVGTVVMARRKRVER